MESRAWVLPEMKCPSCKKALHEPAPRCPHCKLTLQSLDIKFGAVPRHSRYLSDRSGRLPLDEMAELREGLQLFERKFPQSLFSAFVAELQPGNSVSEYAFWLANRARFSAVDRRHGENLDLLLVIDVASDTAALTAGYGFERYLEEGDLQDALDALVVAAAKNGITAGIWACLDAMTRRLRELSMDLKRKEPKPESEYVGVSHAP